MKKLERIVCTAFYAGAFAAVMVLTLLTVIGAGRVLFPDAMLPMELRELASAWLGIGFLPVTLASRHFYKIVRRKLVFLPAGVCLLAALFWLGVWTAGMLRTLS